jgi:hypothetical protein
MKRSSATMASMPTQQGWIRSLVFKTYVHKNLYVLNKGSYAARGKRKKLGLENQLAIKIIDDVPNRKICRKSWAQLIYQVYEVDPLKCPKCGTQMKIIAFILEREEIIRILNHLRMWPIEYPKPTAIDARASPLDLKLLVP